MQLLIMKDDRPPHYKGDIIEIRATGSPWVGLEPDDFIMVEVPGLPVAAFDDKSDPWQQSLAFEVVSRDNMDVYRLRVYSDNTNGMVGAVARDKVEAFISSWGGTIVSVGPNEVVFDLAVYDALTSNEFWEFDISGVVFEVQDYDSATGVFRISADYSGTAINNTTYVERRAMRQGVTVVSHADKVLIFEATSSEIVDRIRDFIRNKAETRNARRRYYFSEAVVDHIVSLGGTITTDVATVESYIKDKMAD